MRISNKLWVPLKDLLLFMSKDRRLGTDERSIYASIVEGAEKRGHTTKIEDYKISQLIKKLIIKKRG